MPQITSSRIRTLIDNSMESLKPIEVLEWLKQFVGKPITTRLADKLNAQFPGEEFQVVRQYGMTYIENEVHRQLRYKTWTDKKAERAMYKKAIYILIAHSTGSVPLDLIYLTEKNTQYTKGAVERNEARRQSLKKVDRLAEALDVYLAAGRDLAHAMKPFHADQYAIEDEFLRQEKFEDGRYTGAKR